MTPDDGPLDDPLHQMEARYRLLTEESDEVLVEFRAGRIVYAGPNMALVSGLDPADVTGRHLTDLIHPDDLKLLIKYSAPDWTGRFRETFRVLDGEGAWQWREATGVRHVRDGVPTTMLLLRDVSERMQHEALRRDSETRLRALTESLPVGVYQTDAEGKCVYTNSRWREITGLTAEQALGDGWATALHPDDARAVAAAWRTSIDQNRDFSLEFRFLRPDGSVALVQSRATAVRGSDGAVSGFVGNVEDITEARRADEVLRESEELHRAVISVMADGIVVHDRTGAITTCNAAAERILGMSADEIMGRTSTDPTWRAVREDGTPFAGDEHPASVTLSTGQPCEGVVMGLSLAFGGTRWLTINSRPLFGASGELEAAVVSFTDITAQRAAEEALSEKSRELALRLDAEREHARRDALTGALNHGAIAGVLTDLAAEPDACFAIAMIDVDGMKAVNDTYGHQVGDLLLRAVTEAIEGDDSTTGRYGGDEFVVVLPGAGRREAEVYQHQALVRLAMSQITDPASGASVPVIASVGIAVYPEDAADAKALIEIADASMYEQKRHRKEAQATPLASMRGLGDERAARMIGELVPLLTSPASLPEKLRLVSHRLSVASEYDAVNIDVFDNRDDTLMAHNVFAKASDEILQAWTREQEAQQNHPIGELLGRTKLPAIIDDIATDERLTETQRTLLVAVGLRCGISVPMLWDEELVGILSVGSKREGAFTANDAQFLMTVATQVTAIVQLSSMVEELRDVNARMADARADTVMMLAASAEAHDHGTGVHLQSVRDLTCALAAEMGYSERDAQELGLAAALHDIGKVSVAESVLSQAGALSGEQWAIMREHTVRGAEFLSKHTSFWVASIVARHHHERWDGGGYPDGLTGDAIPEAAAIVTVADSFDAMTSDRPYRAARTVDDAVAEIVAGRGTQFSPRVVDALLRLYGHAEHAAAVPEAA